MSRRLLVADGTGVLALEPGEASWMSRRQPGTAGAESIAVAPGESGLVFVGCREHGVLRSIDGGATYEALDFPRHDALAIAVSAADGAVYVGCEPTRLFRSRDDGESWQELDALLQVPSAGSWVYPPRPWTHHVRTIAPSPHDPQLVLVGIERGGVMRTVDDGVTWEDRRPGSDCDCHALVWHSTTRDRAYQAGGGGAFWSHDGGSSWQRVEDGRDRDFRHYMNGLAVDPDDPDRWYVTASPTPGLAHGAAHADAAIYRWSGSGPWRRLQGGLPASLASFPFALAITADGLYAGFEDGGIWAGTDHGERWQELDIQGDPVRRLRAIVAI